MAEALEKMKLGNIPALMFRNKKEGKYNAVFGWYKKKITKVIRNFNSPYADIYRILTYSYYIISRRYDSKKYIETLKESDKSIDLNVLKITRTWISRLY